MDGTGISLGDVQLFSDQAAGTGGSGDNASLPCQRVMDTPRLASSSARISPYSSGAR
jgi:hypothetical protein